MIVVAGLSTAAAAPLPLVTASTFGLLSIRLMANFDGSFLFALLAVFDAFVPKASILVGTPLFGFSFLPSFSAVLPTSAAAARATAAASDPDRFFRSFAGHEVQLTVLVVCMPVIDDAARAPGGVRAARGPSAGILKLAVLLLKKRYR